MKFPVVESHYCRESSKRRFLSSDLNVTKMFEPFKKEHKDAPVKEHFCRSIFNQHFNLGFHQPKIDQCEICLEYKNSNEKSKLEKKYNEHLKNKDVAQKLKTEIKELCTKDKQQLCAAFDLQKVLQVPYGENSRIFLQM